MSSTTPFRAIYLGENEGLSIRQIGQSYIPQDSQALIEVKYSAINPADLRHYYHGWNTFVAGYEWIGPVIAVGPNSPYKIGEVLFGLAMFGHRRPLHRGAHQDYLLADVLGTSRVPEDMLAANGTIDEQKQAWGQVVSWPVGVHTAVDMLFNELGFAFPGVEGLEDGTDPKGRAILIWGGSSTVGLSAIQIAKVAGFSPIYTTASPQNHEKLRELGATHVFDYRSPTVVADIQAAVAASGKELSVIADAVTTGTGVAEPPSDTLVDLSKSSVAIAKQTLTEGAKDIRLVASLPVEFDPDWRFCIAMRLPHEAPREYARTKAAVEWVYKNHKAAFHVPRVRFVKGAEEGLKAIHEVFDGKISMEKVVIEHPL